jgi:hypothetical protein
MNARQRIIVVLVLLLSLVVSGCGPGQVFGPTLTPTPTFTPTKTNTPTPTKTPTPTNTPTFTPSPTPIPPSEITGKIFVDGINQPYETNVLLVDSDKKAVVTNANTDPNGMFSFSDVKPGNYVLQIDVPLPNPMFDTYHCKMTIGGEKGWAFSANMKIVGSKLSVTSVIYQSDPIKMQGKTVEQDLNLVCK